MSELKSNPKETTKSSGIAVKTATEKKDVAAVGRCKREKYRNCSAYQSPMYKKKVVFVFDENDPANADAVRGHLEVVGDIEHVPTFYEKYIKRIFDIVLSSVGIVVLSPLYAITAIAIKIDDPGPVIFRQKRIAKEKGYFELMKFRSMKLDTPHNVPTHQLENPDQYMLKIGKIIRKLSIDELPQLINILSGSMTLIGPRPALWNQDYLVAERDRYGANDIKPGLTGLAQIRGRDELEIPDKAKLDGEYARALCKSSGAGFKMDVKVFVGSIKAVLKRDGVVEGGTGEIHAQEEEEKGVEADEKDPDNGSKQLHRQIV